METLRVDAWPAHRVLKEQLGELVGRRHDHVVAVEVSDQPEVLHGVDDVVREDARLLGQVHDGQRRVCGRGEGEE